MPDEKTVPRHVGYIVDGNRRWAKRSGLPSYEGHLAGYQVTKDVLRATVNAGVEYISFYLFSTENWKRESGEVSKLMNLVHKLVTTDLGELEDAGIRVRFAGTDEGLREDILTDMREAERRTKDLKKGTVIICFNYGGQREIVDAIKAYNLDENKPELDEKTFAQYLYLPDVPPCDLIVRTGGEHRLSNFQLWRAAYSEFIFVQKFWPELTSDDITVIMDEYAKRSRRFGG